MSSVALPLRARVTPGLAQMLNKVPEVTLYFWIIKILCTTVGETFASFGVNNWRSHGRVAPVQNVVDQLTLLTASVRPNLTDSYGSGVLRVYALNIDDRRHDAIVTAIIKPPPGFGGRDSIRVAIGTSWGLVEGEWRLFSIMNNYVLGPEFLDPHPEVVAGLYPRWEPYGPR